MFIVVSTEGLKPITLDKVGQLQGFCIVKTRVGRRTPFLWHTAALKRASTLLSQGHNVVLIGSCFDEPRHNRPADWRLACRMVQRVYLKLAAVHLMSTSAYLCAGIPLRAVVLEDVRRALEMASGWECLQHDGVVKAQNIVGHAMFARHLFVGEKINKKFAHFDHWPFYDFGGSAMYITRALDRIGFDEATTMWTNIHGPEAHIFDLLKKRWWLNVIALGKEASDVLSLVGIKHRSVPHPQFFKRFRYADDYGALLKESMT